MQMAITKGEDEKIASDRHDDSDQHRQQTKKAGRVIYDCPSADPQLSAHWERLNKDHDEKNSEGDGGDGESVTMINTHEDLICAFERDVNSLKASTNDDTNSENENYLKLAVWSFVVGYCEALATHSDAGARYALFPIPMESLRSLVNTDFLSLLKQAQSDSSSSESNKKNGKDSDSVHRKTVRAVANAIWKRAQNKSSTMQDELHANSLYTCLCGDVDRKSLDCFGAALLVVIGMNLLGFNKSCLTLSEDHAYESHIVEDVMENNENSTDNNDQQSHKRATCEVAVPGNTKAAQSKRGNEISFTFEQLKRDNITAETSWLYMARNPVLCDTPGMVLAALVSNLNCDVGKQKSGKPPVVSSPLYKMKRDMLWVLYEAGYMDRFPFALIELGECEEHLSSQKGMEWVDASNLLNSNGTLVLRNEKLFLDAISVSKSVYGDAQVYPYFYAGHYHKDAGRDDQSQEYRLVESLRLYAEATRVASTYRYDTKDCLQLMKHMTTVAALISKDILNDGKDCRIWQRRENAIASATWLIGCFDSLLFWEENEQSSFVEVLSIRHKHCLSKLFQLFTVDIRAEAISHIHLDEEAGSGASAVTEGQLVYFRKPRSKRLAKDSLLVVALSKGKVVVRELEMALPSNGEGRSTRQRKRARV